MAHRRTGLLRGAVRGPKRATQWLGSSTETDISSLAAGTVLLDQTFAFGEPATIVRTRGTLWVGSDQVVADEFPFGALGMAVVTDEAVAAGAASIPAPEADSDSDQWFLWTPFQASLQFGSAIGFQSPSMARYDFDSKAQRKVHDGSTAVVMIENASATDGMRFLLLFRMLVMLHG